MGWRPWFFENLKKNGVGFSSNGASRWEWRRHRVAFASLIGLMLSGLVVQLVTLELITPPAVPNSGQPIRTPSYWPMVTAFVFVPYVLPVVVFFGLMAGIGRARNAAKAAGGYACPNCLHDLSAVPVERCPECGQRIVHGALPTLWTRKVRRRFFASRETRFDETGFDGQGLSRYEAKGREMGGLVAVLVPLGAFVPIVGVEYAAEHTGIDVAWAQGWAASFALPAAGLLIFAGPLLAYLLWRGLRLRRALRASDGVACPRCLRDLSRAETEACPGCGQRVLREELKRAWRVRMMAMGMAAAGEDGK